MLILLSIAFFSIKSFFSTGGEIKCLEPVEWVSNRMSSSENVNGHDSSGWFEYSVTIICRSTLKKQTGVTMTAGARG